MKRHKEWGLSFVHFTLSPSLLPPCYAPMLQHSVPPMGHIPPWSCPTWVPSTSYSSYTNWSSMGPFHGVQSFRNRLLQHRSSMTSQVMPENLLQHKLSMGPLLPLGIPLLPGPPQAAGRSLLPHGPPWAAEEQLPHHGLHHGLQGNLCSST